MLKFSDESTASEACSDAGPASGPRADAADRRWYVAAVLQGKEDSAERHLRRQEFDTFLPRQKRTVRHARKLLVKHTAFFPGYVFIRLDPSRQRWRSINGTIGVRGIVCQGSHPSPCPRGLVERLIEHSDGDGTLDFRFRLRPGRQVRIAVGPLTDFIGTLERLDGAGRARVLLSIMNSEIEVTVHASDLAA